MSTAQPGSVSLRAGLESRHSGGENEKAAYRGGFSFTDLLWLYLLGSLAEREPPSQQQQTGAE